MVKDYRKYGCYFTETHVAQEKNIKNCFLGYFTILTLYDTFTSLAKFVKIRTFNIIKYVVNWLALLHPHLKLNHLYLQPKINNISTVISKEYE